MSITKTPAPKCAQKDTLGEAQKPPKEVTTAPCALETNVRRLVQTLGRAHGALCVDGGGWGGWNGFRDKETGRGAR